MYGETHESISHLLATEHFEQWAAHAETIKTYVNETYGTKQDHNTIRLLATYMYVCVFVLSSFIVFNQRRWKCLRRSGFALQPLATGSHHIYFIVRYNDMPVPHNSSIALMNTTFSTNGHWQSSAEICIVLAGIHDQDLRFGHSPEQVASAAWT